MLLIIIIISTKTSIETQRNLNFGSLRTLEYSLLNLDDEKYPKPAFDVLPLHFIGDDLPQDINSYLQEGGYQYLAVEYWQPESINKQTKKIIESAELIKEYRLDVESGDFVQNIHGNFYQPAYWLFKLDKLGPVIGIYKL